MNNNKVKLQSITVTILSTSFFFILGTVPSTKAENAILSWKPNSESDLAGYKVYQRILPSGNPQQIFSGMPSTPSAPKYTVTGLQTGKTYKFFVTAFDQSGNESGPSREVGKTITGNSTPTPMAWEASSQISGGSWSDSSWSDRSFRILLDGKFINASGSTVQLTLQGRKSRSYKVQRISLVQRAGNSLNGIDSSSRKVTFGGTWDNGVTIPAGATVTSDPITFDLEAGRDVFLTFWVPERHPTVYRDGGPDTYTWTTVGADNSAKIDWGNLNISDERSYVYIAKSLKVVQPAEKKTSDQVNFQPNGASVPKGYIKDSGAVYTTTRGYGWNKPVDSRERNSVGDQRLDTFVFSYGATWQLQSPQW